MKIAIIGTGYVGLVTGAELADFGWNVTCVDIDKKKIEELKKGKIPFYESGLESLVKKNLKETRLSFTDNICDAIKNSDVIFIAVGIFSAIMAMYIFAIGIEAFYQRHLWMLFAFLESIVQIGKKGV